MADDLSHITVVTNEKGHAALVDRNGELVAGPADPADDGAWSKLVGWLRGYLLDRD